MPYRYKDEVDKELDEIAEGSPFKDRMGLIKYVHDNIDLTIADFVRELNLLGYPTETSCAGGPGHLTKEGGRGFVAFSNDEEWSPEERKEIKALARKYGLRHFKLGLSMATFDPLGGPPSEFSGPLL